MQLDVHDEQRLLLETVTAWAAELAPAARELDAQARWPAAAWSQAGELGLWTLAVPAEAPDAGGLGLGLVDLCLGLAPIAGQQTSLAVAIGLHNLAGRSLCRGSAATAGLAALAAGEPIGWLWRADTAPAAAWEEGATAAASARTSAGDAPWLGLATGSPSSVKAWLVCPGPGQPWRSLRQEACAGLASLAGQPDHPGTAAGASCSPPGLRELRWLRLQPPAAFDLAGASDPALEPELLTVLAASAVGVAERAVAEAAGYALQRQQFGQPIASYQDIQWQLADGATAAAAARQSVLHAAWACDQRHPEAPRWARQAKLLADQAATLATGKGLQVHGGYGYTKDYAIERLFRQAQSLAVLPWSGPTLRAACQVL